MRSRSSTAVALGASGSGRLQGHYLSGGLAPSRVETARDLLVHHRPRDESFPPMLSPRNSLHCDRANYPSPKYFIRAAEVGS